MKVLALIALILLCIGEADAQKIDTTLRDEVLAMEKVDQDARRKCTGTADEQTKCIVEIAEKIDTPHTQRLTQIVATHGFPSRSIVGERAQRAFMIMLQHVTDESLRAKLVEPIKLAFERKEIGPMEYANFIDRHLIRTGKRQLYGSGFDMKDGKMVLSPTEDLSNLDARRKAIGLPPMTEVVKKMKEIYKLEVVIPKS